MICTIAGYITNNSDCDDTKASYTDNDGDGYGAGDKHHAVWQKIPTATTTMLLVTSRNDTMWIMTGMDMDQIQEN